MKCFRGPKKCKNRADWYYHMGDTIVLICAECAWQSVEGGFDPDLYIPIPGSEPDQMLVKE